MKLRESQTVEFKEVWRDEYLKTVCAFANTDGGVFYIGIDNGGNVVGVKNAKRLVEELPNKVISAFVITAKVEVEEKKGLQFVKMTVPKSNTVQSYRGRYYVRSGSTTQEVKGGELQKLVLRANNLTWDAIGVENANFDDIDVETVRRFVIRAIEHNRLPPGVDHTDIKKLFRNLRLLTDDGMLKRAAIMLFGKDPVRFFTFTTFKIGRFRGTDPTDLVNQDVIEGNLFTMFDLVINTLRSKYLLSPISYNGMVRVETLEIPEKALREAILNALIHKDYTSNTAIAARVYEPTVSIWNRGELEHLQLKDLSKPHDSYQRNPLIAEMFFRAGYIEAWGRGTLTIIEETEKSGLTKPKFNVRQGGLEVIFERNPMLFSENGVGDTINYAEDGIKDGVNATINGDCATINATINSDSATINGENRDVNGVTCGVNGELCGVKRDVNVEFCGVNGKYWDVNDKVCGVNDEICGVNNVDAMIVNLMTADKEITVEQIANATKSSKRRIEYRIAQLKKDGIIMRVGADKNGYWRVI